MRRMTLFVHSRQDGKHTLASFSAARDRSRQVFVFLVLEVCMTHSLLALRSVVAVGSLAILASRFPFATHLAMIPGGR